MVSVNSLGCLAQYVLLHSSAGEAHFGAHQQPYLYFKVLLLTAQFEAVSSVYLTFTQRTSIHIYTCNAYSAKIQCGCTVCG